MTVNLTLPVCQTVILYQTVGKTYENEQIDDFELLTEHT